jgi:galactokinase
MRDCCEELFLTFFYSFKSMSSRGGTSKKGGGGGGGGVVLQVAYNNNIDTGQKRLRKQTLKLTHTR